MKKINVAVDGTAGSGKSFIFGMVANKIGYELVDTGLIYRAFTYYVYLNGAKFEDKKEIIKLIDNFTCDKKQGKIFINNGKDDVTDKLTSLVVVNNINYVTVIPEVREKIVKVERQLGNKPGVIELGRDITSVVLPDAKLKIYLDAPLDVRAKRRFEQDEENGIRTTYQDVYDAIEKRDANDQNRKVGPLKIVPDAWYIDTAKYESPELLVDAIIERIKDLEENNG